MAITYTPEMNLPVPGVGNEIGPNYANDVNQCFSILDGHNHSIGNGSTITPAGLTISTDLPFLTNNAIDLRSVRLNSQLSALSGGSDLGCLYNNAGDLYYNDSSGNQIAITAMGGIAGSPGSIANLVAPASATYSASTKTFTWASGTSGKAAAMDNGAVTIRQTNTASANGVTIASPNALASSYSLTFPAALPGSTQYVSLDASGNLGSVSADAIGSAMTSVGANAIGVTMTSTGANAIGVSMTSTGADAVANTRTRTTGQTVAAGGVALSTTSSGLFSGSSASFADVTNVTVTITTTGRPVFLQLVDSPADGSAALGVVQSSSTIAQALFRILNTTSSTNIATHTLTTQGVSGSLILQVPASSLSGVDLTVNGVAGTYTYKLQYEMIQGTSVSVSNVKLLAYEL